MARLASDARAYGTDGLRRRVLDAWTASPARFREDANAEEDARTGYRDRLVVELAQNAVDAGGTALLLRLSGDTLLAANTGAPLTAAGVEALSTLRASAKRSGTTVGRYGVGFAAVLAVSDAPMIGSRGMPSVRWSAARTAEQVRAVPELAGELAARGGHVPVLRLPYEDEPLDVPDGYDTAVVLPLTDAGLARSLLAAVETTLPLVLRGLESLVVEVDGTRREVTCTWDGDGPLLDGRPWAWVRRAGTATAEELAGLGAEARPDWAVDAFAPRTGPLGTPQLLHAPTPTDEMVSLPVLLSVTAPLEPTRRRLVPGPYTARVLAAAGSAVAALAALVDDPRPFVPVGLDAGAADAAVRAAAAAELAEAPVLQGKRGRDCLVLEPGLERVAPLLGLDGLLPWPPSPALAALGVRTLDTAAAVELLAAREREPAEWRAVYEALGEAPDRDALAALPVPLADGRVVTGVRGALLPSGPLPPEVRGLPLRLVHAEAVHPLLERLGAAPATAAALLAEPGLEAWVAEQDAYDDELARAVCALCRVAGDPGWVASTLLLPSQDGGAEVAGDLVLPGGLLDRCGADLPRLAAPDWLDAETACAAGVLDRPAVVEMHDLSADDPPDLDDAAGWLEEVGPQPSAQVVRDLDLAADPRQLLDGMLGDRDLRAALLAPSSYAAWWLGRHGALGLPAAELALPGDLDGLYAVPPDLPADVLRALGVVSSAAELVGDPAKAGDLLDRLGSAESAVTAERARGLYVRLARRWAGDEEAPDPPLTVRSADGHVAARADAVVVDAPDLLPLLAGRAPLAVPAGDAAAVADLLDLDLLSELYGAPSGDGVETPVPQPLSGFGPSTYLRCGSLVQDGTVLPWRWYDGVLWATDTGLADGVAWASGRWADRHVLRVAAAGGDLRTARLEAALEEAAPVSRSRP